MTGKGRGERRWNEREYGDGTGRELRGGHYGVSGWDVGGVFRRRMCTEMRGP